MPSPSLRIVLASRSPRRREILKSAGVTFDCVVPGVDEDYDRDSGRDARGIALEIAGRKAVAVAENHRDALVIAADTIVVLDDGSRETILGIPANRAESRSMIERLSGRPHKVITAVAMRQADKEFSEADSAMVEFRSLNREEIDMYVATGEGDDKAGAYAVQGEGSRLIANLSGDIETVIGLPLAIVRKGLSHLGFENVL